MKDLVRGLYGDSPVKSEAYTRYIICQKMGWDYYTYESQPSFFIEQLLLIMTHENQKIEKDGRAVKQKAKKIK